MENKQISKIESYDIANSQNTIDLAQDLAKFIKEKNLYTNIQGKAFVNVEGWQYAGARLGILPIIEDISRIPTEGDEIRYQAKISLLNLRNQQKVGSGFAICSNRENGKRNYQEFAIASMAQTRGIGKAYRNLLAWIIRAAGYEPTPAEEMDYEVVQEKPKAKPKKDPSPVVVNNDDDPTKASVQQKRELITLLSNSLITEDERNRAIETINLLTPDKAQLRIQKIKKIIEERKAVAHNNN